MTTEDRRTDDQAEAGATGATDGTTEPEEDTEGQSFHNYELARAVSRERATEAARMARDNARAREAREANRSRR